MKKKYARFQAGFVRSDSLRMLTAVILKKKKKIVRVVEKTVKFYTESEIAFERFKQRLTLYVRIPLNIVYIVSVNINLFAMVSGYARNGRATVSFSFCI